MSEDDELLRDKTFVSWMLRTPRGVEGLIVSVLYVVVAAGKNIPRLGGAIPAYEANKTLYDSLPSAFQCLALVPPLWQCARIGPPDNLRKTHPVAAQACDQFAKCLTALIATWIAFYFLVFLWAIRPIHGLEPWTDFLNNMQAAFLFACYWTLTAITIPEPGSDKRNVRDAVSLPLVLNYSLWVVLVFHLVDLSLAYQGSPVSRFWVQVLSGLAVGVCMALLVGCLESEYLNAPGTRALTACLYCYAVLQLAYLGFNPSSTPAARSAVEKFLEAFATITSLPLKLLLIGFCYWTLKEGRLAFYMEMTRKLIVDAPTEWEEFAKSRLQPAPPVDTQGGQSLDSSKQAIKP